MSTIRYITPYGNSLTAVMADGRRILCQPTGMDMWIAGGSGTGPVPDTITITDCNGNSVTLPKTSVQNAARIKAVGESTPNVNRKAIVCAFMTSLVETSSIRNLSNIRVYPESANCPGNPPDGDGSDHDSLGLFQQRPESGWGEPCEIMSPEYAAAAFFGGPTGPNGGSPRGLLDIPGWETMPYGELCQAVQVSAFPDRYACWQSGAEALYDALSGSGNYGEFAWPFPPNQITSGFRPPDRPTHTGIDFGRGSSNVAKTPIPNSHAGTVEVAGVYQGYGNTVIVNCGTLTNGSRAGQEIKSLYGHMYDGTIAVSVGETVSQLQTLGGIGNTGQSRGNHLHWEIWANGVKIDPEAFMREYGQ